MLFRPSARPSSIVTFSLLRYTGFRAKNWAFWQMAPAPPRLARVRGVTFSKLMGCGAGNGFSLRPDLGAYAWLACWESEAAARDFFARHPWWRRVRELGGEQFICWLTPTLAHGQWNGREPFRPAAKYDADQPLAVFTRATVDWRRVIDFRRHVPLASQLVSADPGCALSVGVGEYPLVMQATFSLWRSGRAMREFAYRDPIHKRIIRRTRERNWYREELFARFRIEGVEGSWKEAGLATSLGFE